MRLMRPCLFLLLCSLSCLVWAYEFPENFPEGLKSEFRPQADCDFAGTYLIPKTYEETFVSKDEKRYSEEDIQTSISPLIRRWDTGVVLPYELARIIKQGDAMEIVVERDRQDKFKIAARIWEKNELLKTLELAHDLSCENGMIQIKKYGKETYGESGRSKIDAFRFYFLTETDLVLVMQWVTYSKWWFFLPTRVTSFTDIVKLKRQRSNFSQKN